MVPSKCADALKKEHIDLGLIPSIEFLKGKYKNIPGISLSSSGSVLSVLLLVRNDRVKNMLVDIRSRTSVYLSIIIAREIFKENPSIQTYNPASFYINYADNWDARLLIGDDALFLNRDKLKNTKVYDLGEMWYKMTGLPFTYALWSSYSQQIINEIANTFARSQEQYALIYKYLSTHMKYNFGKKEMLGLKEFEGILKTYRLL